MAGCILGKISATTLSFRSSHPEVFLSKSVLRRWSKFTGEHPCRSVISIKLVCNFIEITLWHGCSAVNLLHIFRRSLPRNTPAWLLLKFVTTMQQVKCSPFQQKIANLTLKSWILSRKFKEYITCLDFIYGKGV